MRYLLPSTQRTELAARLDYLYDIFKLYFLPGKPEGSYIPLYPIGTRGPDILFITGHIRQVQYYLKSEIDKIPEATVVITSCFGDTFKQFGKQKEIYVPPTKTLCAIRDGAPFGFGFGISDVELDFYNASGSVEERINSVYRRL